MVIRQVDIPPERSSVGSRSSDFALSVLVFALALLLRLPYLDLIPRFTDETVEALWGWRISQGDFWPLTHHISYLGVVYPYLLAALFKIFGPNVLLPRLMVASAGALTASATYVLARRGLDPLASLFAAIAFSCSSAPILVNAHIAYSGSLAPLFVTAALCLTTSAMAGTRRWLLPAAGFVWGLALQTHPATFPLLPGVGAAFLLTGQGRQRLRGTGAVAGILAFVLGYGNMIWYNLTTGLTTLDRLQARPDYYGSLADPATYVNRMGELALRLLAMIIGVPDWPSDTVSWLAGLLAVALVLAGCIFALRRSRISSTLLGLVALLALATMPIFNDKYTFPNGVRYLTVLLPVCFVIIADLAVSLWAGAFKPVMVAKVAALFVTIGLVVAPLIWLQRAYDASLEMGATNASILTWLDNVGPAIDGKPVLVDVGLNDRKVEGGGKLDLVVGYLLTMSRVPYVMAEPYEVAGLIRQGSWPAMALSYPTYTMLVGDCFPEIAPRISGTAVATARFDKFDHPEWSVILLRPSQRDPEVTSTPGTGKGEQQPGR